ncbi:substrate-binding periplasmic protein [Pseudothauera rhizosphaerae]|uniref:Amino acid ABC transporter substrate-binding protein n=1 Tax=Pseudothauera rhizosphaerae TaxID=2565932 RepID=A0A4S4AU47_9RHOO|nr:transporter substrate-binding domain-containing protein [Pseudothauera rhizosphaerae]THF63451.1 amino acid ABC transporter substrate-binding protein [Pseudothauera rhizosphaerae]
MPTARTAFRTLLAAAAFGLALGSAHAQDRSLEELQWISEEYAPYNFSENGVAKGIAVDVLVKMWEVLGVPRSAADVRILPWARGYRMAQEQPGTCLFSMTITPERRQLFAFVEPLVDTSVTIVAPTAKQLRVAAAKDLDALTIGVVRDDIGEQALHSAGIKSALVRTDSARSLVRMLEGGRFDAISYGLDTALWNMKLEGIDTAGYKAVFTVREGIMGYACHKDIDPALLARLQGALDKLLADGSVERIKRQYLR